MRKALPNIATSGNLTAGFIALLMVVQGRYDQAVLLVALAAAFDLLDGAIARRCSTAGEFGCNLDYNRSHLMSADHFPLRMPPRTSFFSLQTRTP